MVFNPLFLQVVNNQVTPSLNKAQKLTGPSYLFSDIIKVQLDKNDTVSLTAGKENSHDNNLLSSIISILSNRPAASPLLQIQKQAGMNPDSALNIKEFNLPVLLQQMDKNSSAEQKPAVSSEDINSLLVGNTELFNFINDLLTNHQFDGKISIVGSGDANAENKVAAAEPKNTLQTKNLSAGEVLNLLKKGNTLAVENSAFQSNNGLLITLVELSGAAPSGPGGEKTQTGQNPLNPSEEGTLQTSEALYKLNFSLVNNPEIQGSSIDNEQPVIKLPFTDVLNVSGSSDSDKNVNFTSLPKYAENINLKPAAGNPSLQAGTEGALNKTDAENIISTEPSQQAPSETDPSASQSGDLIMPEVIAKDEQTPEGESALKDKVAVKNNIIENILIESGVKAGKFINIERVKPDSGLQAEGTLPANSSKPVSDVSKINTSSADVKTGNDAHPAPDTANAGTKTGEKTSPLTVAENEVAVNEVAVNEVAVNEDSAVKEDASVKTNAKNYKESGIQEPEVKTGKFINIEKIITASGIQANETQTPDKKTSEMKTQELKTSEQKTPELKAADSKTVEPKTAESKTVESKTVETRTPETKNQETPDPDPVKKEPPAGNPLHGNEKQTQKSDEIPDKKIPETRQVKLQGEALINQKEKDSGAPSLQEKQETSSPLEVKTDAKDNAKNEMNGSSKDENQKSQEYSAANDHPDAKGKQQEEHPFNAGAQLKTGEDSFTVKRTPEMSPFSEAAKTVKAAEVMKEISRFIQQGDKSSIVLKIDPENLGAVKIALDVADKVVHANIEVENEAARKLMENNLNQLYNSLSQNGVQLNSINISLANQEQKQGRMPNQKRRTFTGDSGKDTDDIGELRQKQMGYNTYDYLI